MRKDKHKTFLDRGPTTYEADNKVVVINYDGYKLVDINPNLISDEDIPLKNLADVIEYSEQYLGLGGKTQVLNIGVEDNSLGITTRLIHDMQVSQNAMKIAEALGGNIRDILLSKISGLAHDIGHTPFGHDGEEALSQAVKEVVPEAHFAHNEYGAQLISTIINSVIEANEDPIIQMEHPSENISILEQYKEEIIEAVINHSKYYQYEIQDETISQKSVRLSDTLSFVVTDLLDLMKGDNPEKPEHKILEEKRIIEEINKMYKLSTNQRQEMISVLKLLSQGGDSIRHVHEKLIDEAFHNNRKLLKKDEKVTIIDDIKFLYDITSNIARLEKDDNAKARIEAFLTIGEYYKYICNLQSYNSNESRQNNAFKKRLRTLIRAQSDDESFDKIDDLIKRIKEKGEVTTSKDFLQNISEDDLKIIEVITNDIISSEDIYSLKRITENVTQLIIAEEMRNVPTLITLYTIQSIIQYGKILKEKDAKSILGNEYINRADGKKVNVQELLKNRFRIIYKMASDAKANSDENQLANKSVINLREYNGLTVPEFFYVENGETKSDEVLSYAIFSIQQMENADFYDDSIMHRIRDSLGISSKQYTQIVNNIMKQSRESKEKKDRVNANEKIYLRNISIEELKEQLRSNRIFSSKQLKALKVQAMLPGFCEILDDYIEGKLKGLLPRAMKGEFEPEKNRKIIEEVCLEFSKRFPDISVLEDFVPRIIDKELKSQFAKTIIRKKDKLDFELKSYDIVKLAMQVEERNFIEECIKKSKEYNFDDLETLLLKTFLDSLKENHLSEEERTIFRRIRENRTVQLLTFGVKNIHKKN